MRPCLCMKHDDESLSLMRLHQINVRANSNNQIIRSAIFCCKNCAKKKPCVELQFLNINQICTYQVNIVQ